MQLLLFGNNITVDNKTVLPMLFEREYGYYPKKIYFSIDGEYYNLYNISEELKYEDNIIDFLIGSFEMEGEQIDSIRNLPHFLIEQERWFLTSGNKFISSLNDYVDLITDPTIYYWFPFSTEKEIILYDS